MKNTKEMITLKNVYKSFKVYQDKSYTLTEKIITRGRHKHYLNEVLKGINLTVYKGDVIGLIGENGCGKSTALKLMSRIIYPDKGSVEVNGRVSSLLELGAGFHPDLSGRENIYTNASIFGLSKKEIDSRLNDIIDFSELWDFIDNPVRTYSSGMYMRLAFSVAINVEADILLIDEILAVGDKNFQRKCFNRLHELKKNGITIIIVTHDTSSVEQLCNRAVWINEGIVQKDGTPDQVINSYSEYMYEKEFLISKRQEQERRKAELEKKDYTRKDIYDIYNKYLSRDPEEEAIEYFFKNFDSKKEIEHYIKYSTESMANVFNEKNKTGNEKNISEQDVIDVYRKYLKRYPENETIIKNCCRVFASLDDLIDTILKSSEYKLVSRQETDQTEVAQESKTISVKSVYFTDGGGGRAEKLTSGDDYFFNAEFSVQNSAEEFLFLMEICAINGFLCFSSKTGEPFKLDTVSENNIIRLNIPELRLYPGRYKLFFYASDMNKDIKNSEKSIMNFEVISGDRKNNEGEWELA